MIYPEYIKTKGKYYDLQSRFADLLMMKEKIFTDNLPSGIRYDLDKIQSSKANPMEHYIVQLEDIEKKLSEIRTTLKDWETLLSVQERELRQSKHIQDRVYVMRYLDNMSVSRISAILCYSKRQTYRIIGKIEKMAQNVIKDML